MSTVHVVWHAVPAALQGKGAQDFVPVGLHAPAPLHATPVCAIPAEHVGPGHSASGSRPLATNPHVPSTPAPFLAAVHA
ncbi:MAG: hypothetical protein ACHREM_05385 [Polyangiales bacterium]